AGAAGLAYALALARVGGDGIVRAHGGALARLPRRALPLGHPGRLGRGQRMGGGVLRAGVSRTAASVAGAGGNPPLIIRGWRQASTDARRGGGGCDQWREDSRARRV